ncbi:UDP-N-acetylmuramoylalanine--D-glutamate ligase [Chromatiales bacterium (ex Bugula neritina AB1)]|nr:UDP-N-acetylmuramoylalanine--D-glutamate ligase [Chromatiales bacterium (ex Bugula neritina AB1)]
MTRHTDKQLIVGFGVTGLSVARHLVRNGSSFEIADKQSAISTSAIEELPMLSGVVYHPGDWTVELFCRFDRLIVSPGVPTRSQVFEEARSAGVEIISDVELFARDVRKPVISVTGSNGKSTVVSMIGSILEAAGLRAAVVGNVGLACLDGLADNAIDIYVVELSSFQLENTYSLKSLAATVLNVSEDHMDRYDGIEDYSAVKRRIYNNAEHVLVNTDDARTRYMGSSAKGISFSIEHSNADWYLSSQRNTLNGPGGISADVSALRVSGGHNCSNALAAMALATVALDRVGLHKARQLSDIYTTGLGNFRGLPHRTELVCQLNGVNWFNDSKGTNVGACVSAIKGMSGPVVLIAGGQGKNAEFAPLVEVVASKCRAVILFGEDAEKIHHAIGNKVPVIRAASLEESVERASEIAQSGDCVLLSPACASFDMFRNFEERGRSFVSEVHKLCA